MRLFEENKRFYRGNLHCHTTRSDGKLSPEDVRRAYRELGYDFLALTDHRQVSEQPFMDGDMLLLPGIEMDYTLPGEVVHLIGVGMNEDFTKSHGWYLGPQQGIDAVRRYGGRAILAHPHWSLNTLATLAALKRVTAAEVYNTVSGIPWNGARADSSAILDVAATHGAVYPFTAADDSHQYDGEAGYSYLMAQADALSWPALRDALDAGRFYCSQGPRFAQISLENGVMRVECSPVSHIVFYSNLVWAGGRCQSGDGLTQAEYHCSAYGDESYVRVQLIDSDGKSAWSSPILL